MPIFDPATLQTFRTRQEVAIRTAQHPEPPVVIWIVVSGSEVFIRSVRGAKGRWYKDLSAGGPAVIEIDGQRIDVVAIPAADAASVQRASREYLAKYAASPYAQAMVKPEVLPTTLRLEPR
ncbi:MAG TPA: DUF2255 family protein [Acetobacteraceae bacterium]|nr:DUF2255 family protein [Acetobacteraceae bacterium]